MVYACCKSQFPESGSRMDQQSRTKLNTSHMYAWGVWGERLESSGETEKETERVCLGSGWPSSLQSF